MFELVTKWQLWVILGFVLLIVEMFTPGFVLACFAIACIPPAIITYFGDFELSTQLALFGRFYPFSFLLFAPVALKFLSNRNDSRTSNAEALVGRKGIVVKAISSDAARGGYVKVDGKTWWAFAPEGIEIGEGTGVVVEKVRGASLDVRLEANDSSSEE